MRASRTVRVSWSSRASRTPAAATAPATTVSVAATPSSTVPRATRAVQGWWRSTASSRSAAATALATRRYFNVSAAVRTTSAPPVRSILLSPLGTCGNSTCLHGHCSASQTCICDEESVFPSFSPIQVSRRVLQRAVRVPEQLQRPRTLRRVGVSPLSSPATAPARVSGASPAPAATSRVPATPVAATASVWRRVDCKRGRNSSPGVCVCDEGFQGDHCEQTRRLPRKKTLTTLLALALLGAACGQLAAWRRQSVGTRGRCERRGSRASRRSCGGG